jgi:hypothetical protein
MAVSVLLKTVSMLKGCERACKVCESDFKGLKHAFKGFGSVSNVHEKPSPGLESAGKGCECLYSIGRGRASTGSENA